MSKTRQHTVPVLLSLGKAVPLERFDLREPPLDEARLQQLLFDHPLLLPISEIEGAFQPAVPLAREVGVKSGSVDLLFTSPTGYLTLVETKLWKNPEARRAVVGQVLDYTKELAGWSFEDLEEAVRKARPDMAGPGLVIQRIFEAQGEKFDEGYQDAVARNLKAGRLLLLIVGEGIREDAERIGRYLQGTPGLMFHLALVELALYHTQEEAGAIYVQPRIVAETVEVERAVVEVRGSHGVDVAVLGPSVTTAKPGRGRVTITEEEFFARLRKATSAETESFTQDLLKDLLSEDLGLEPTWGSASVSVRLPDPRGSDREFTVVVLQHDGKFYLGWLGRVAEQGYPPEIARDYLQGVVRLVGAGSSAGAACADTVGGARRRPRPGIASSAPGTDCTDPIPVESLRGVEVEFLGLVKSFVTRIRKEAEAREG